MKRSAALVEANPQEVKSSLRVTSKEKSEVAKNVQMMVPWVQTTGQSADAMSRDKSLQVRLLAERAYTARRAATS